MVETFGEWLRRTREYAGLSRKILEDAAEVATGSVGRWEDHGATPNLKALERICKVLDTDYLVNPPEGMGH